MSMERNKIHIIDLKIGLKFSYKGKTFVKKSNLLNNKMCGCLETGSNTFHMLDRECFVDISV